MGSYDGADICELVGIYLLSLIENIIDKINSSLYRNENGQKIDHVSCKKKCRKSLQRSRF